MRPQLNECRHCGRDPRVREHGPQCPKRAVRCFVCGQRFRAGRGSQIDISGDDEYYPNMKPVCPKHDTDGGEGR